MTNAEWIGRGDIITDNPYGGHAGRYLANGRFGAVMSVFGLNARPKEQAERPADGRSQYMHMAHYGRFSFFSQAVKARTTADYILPLLRLYWDCEPKEVSCYRQRQSLYDGTLQTEFTLPNGLQINVTDWFDMVNKDLTGVAIDASRGGAAVRLSVVSPFVPYPFVYRESTTQSVSISAADGCRKIAIACESTVNNARSVVYLHTNADVEQHGTDLLIHLRAGQNRLYLSYGAPAATAERDASLQRTIAAWHAIWDNSGIFSFPHERMQETYMRSLAYCIASYCDRSGAIQPANGLTGNMFPFHFVQDMEYIAPALMMTGHVDIVQGWVANFAERIDKMRRYAKRLWPEADGVYPPWELPFGDIDGYHSPSMPVMYCYEPHNTGYLCRMASEAAEYAGDEAWARRYAYPLIEECAKFYRAACFSGESKQWHLKWYPSIGQDEAGGCNQTDYLCCLYSANYCFRAMVRHGLDGEGVYARLLSDGLAFDNLMSKDGTLHTAAGADNRGRQKHPVQLDGLAFMPVSDKPEPCERLAYAARRRLTARAGEPFYFGWTLGEFLLAGANLGDAAGWRRDFDDMRASDCTDSDWVQIYETSGETEKSFYITTHGLILQSMIRNYVNDYRGRLDIAACPVCEEGAAFEKIRTRFGVTLSGTVGSGRCECTLTADRDCAFVLEGRHIRMKKGEVKHMLLPIKRGEQNAL